MIRVVVNGARGRMGQEVVKAVTADDELEMVGEADLGDDLAQVIKDSQAQVVVDFTHVSCGFENTLRIIESGAHPVVGTSGFKQEQVEKLAEVSEKNQIGGIIAPNFAIGAVLMMMFAKEAAAYLPDVEIIELHHDRKADYPSGTAVKTAEMIAEARVRPGVKVEQRAVLEGARGADLEGIPIHSVRLPGFVAHQKVIFGGVGQSLTISHDSINRESFMPGVCLACKKVVGQKKLLYGLENIL